MKKTILLGLFVLILSGSQAWSLGIGAAFEAPFGNDGVNPGVALSVKLDKLPWVFGLGFSASNNAFGLGATADYWMAQGKLIDFLDYYAGPGLYAGLSSSSVNLGIRIPVGIDAYLLNKKLELFLEIAPALGLGLSPVQFPTFGLQDALGFRFWF